jgi:predicted metalloprotease
MRWQGQRQSQNVEDRRGLRPAHAAIGGGGMIIVALIAWALGLDPRVILNQTQMSTPSTQVEQPIPAGQEEMAQFTSVVLAETEDVWRQRFQEMNRTYQEPKLVLFTEAVESACGMASAAVGPFYCPNDQNVYIDLEFYRMLKERLNAPGDFAQAYVIAHEIGHHVQKQLGIMDEFARARSQASEAEANALSVRMELQADFLAGIWAHDTQQFKNILEAGDIDEALNAASQIGDDRLQQAAQGAVEPDSFTHGTSEQRVRWFKLGYETGDLSKGDTFSAGAL